MKPRHGLPRNKHATHGASATNFALCVVPAWCSRKNYCQTQFSRFPYHAFSPHLAIIMIVKIAACFFFCIVSLLPVVTLGAVDVMWYATGGASSHRFCAQTIVELRKGLASCRLGLGALPQA